MLAIIIIYVVLCCVVAKICQRYTYVCMAMAVGSLYKCTYFDWFNQKEENATTRRDQFPFHVHVQWRHRASSFLHACHVIYWFSSWEYETADRSTKSKSWKMKCLPPQCLLANGIGMDGDWEEDWGRGRGRLSAPNWDWLADWFMSMWSYGWRLQIQMHWPDLWMQLRKGGKPFTHVHI